MMAVPPGFSRKEAIEILLDFQAENKDGVGYAYVEDGEFVVRKYPYSLSKALKKQKDFLRHMPYNGWTIVHLRAGTHGENKVENTHPFVVNDWCICHNGVWSDYKLARALLKDDTFIGDTDSEVAAHVINFLGPTKFVDSIEYGGVYLGLKKDGSLYTIKTTGQLEMVRKNAKVIIASEFNEKNYPTRYESLYGWAHFNALGKLTKQHALKFAIEKGNYEPSDAESEGVFASEFAEPFVNGFENFGGFRKEETNPVFVTDAGDMQMKIPVRFGRTALDRARSVLSRHPE